MGGSGVDPIKADVVIAACVPDLSPALDAAFARHLRKGIPDKLKRTHLDDVHGIRASGVRTFIHLLNVSLGNGKLTAKARAKKFLTPGVVYTKGDLLDKLHDVQSDYEDLSAHTLSLPGGR